jgi:peptidoglycan hydrolase-like protein with peptidoglycan-binding domain
MIRTLLTAAALLVVCTAPAAPADTDPLQVVVSLRQQKLEVFRGTTKITEAPISSGKAGHSTPTGVFSVLHKRKFHRSNIYSNAPMPWMQRLTWTGIALHEGKLPGYPASHGCVRLPDGFAEELYGMTSPGDHVVITGESVVPRVIGHPVLPQPAAMPIAQPVAYEPVPRYAGNTRIADNRPAALANDANPNASGEPKRKQLPLRILVTRSERGNMVSAAQAILSRLGYYTGDIDGIAGQETAAAVRSFQELHGLPPTGIVTAATRSALFRTLGKEEPPTGRLFVRSGFEPLFDAPIHIDDVEMPLGTHLFTAMEFDAAKGSTQWQVVTLENRLSDYSRAIHGIDRTASDYVTAESALARIKVPDDVMARISALMTPGVSLAISDTGLGPYTGWQTDFVVTTKIGPGT